MDIDDLKGRKVITIDEGEKMGQVSDALLDLSTRRLVSLLVTSGGLFGGSRHTLDRDGIHRIGPDAIMVQHSDTLREGDKVPDGLIRMSDLRKRTILTESGRELGHVVDLQLSDDYTIIDIVMSSGSGPLRLFGSTTTIPVEDVVAFGDVITVRDALFGEPGG